jgi:Ca2+-transporting ATPase
VSRPASLANVAGLPAPLNAMQILWINIIMDGPPAQSLGVEPVDAAVLLRAPRPRGEPIITREVMARVLAAAACITAGTLYVFVSEMGAAGGGAGDRRDTTMTFTTFVVFDMFNALACRSAHRSVRDMRAAANPFFLAAVGGSLLGQLGVVYFPPLQAVFQTEALALADWARIAALASSVLLVDEAFKAWRRAADRSAAAAGAPEGAGARLLSALSWTVLKAQTAERAEYKRTDVSQV